VVRAKISKKNPIASPMAKAETEPTKTAGADCESACQDSLSLANRCPTLPITTNARWFVLPSLPSSPPYPPKADIHQSVSQVCFGPDIKGNNQRWRVMKRLISSGSGHAARTRRRFIDLYLAPSP